MIIKPRTKGFICVTAHPEGCAKNVQEQIDYARRHPMAGGPKSALILGASAGYGLASRVCAAFGCGAATLGVSFEREPTEKSCASAGYYNTAYFDKAAAEQGLVSLSLNGDAFSDEVKRQVIDAARGNFGKFDLIVYSLAAPRRTDPDTGEKYASVIKPIGNAFTQKDVDFHTGEVKPATVAPATEKEISDTVHVMGGEDWARWIDALADADLLAPGVKTVAYSYIGPELTHAVYTHGTIGRAKDDLLRTADALRAKLAPFSGDARISVNKALVTQASSAIPVVPLYISILYKVMKDAGLHEGCVEQIARMLPRLYSEPIEVDELGRLRMDDLEMREDVQSRVMELWREADSSNIEQLSDLAGYRAEFLKLFGFRDDVDTDVDISPIV